MNHERQAKCGFPRLHLGEGFLPAFCRKWSIRELSLFGSVLRDDFKAESDVDVLVQFEGQARWGVFDLIDMADELESKIGRKVHLAEKDGLRNPFRREEILNTREIVYAG